MRVVPLLNRIAHFIVVTQTKNRSGSHGPSNLIKFGVLYGTRWVVGKITIYRLMTLWLVKFKFHAVQWISNVCVCDAKNCHACTKYTVNTCGFYTIGWWKGKWHNCQRCKNLEEMFKETSHTHIEQLVRKHGFHIALDSLLEETERKPSEVADLHHEVSICVCL